MNSRRTLILIGAIAMGVVATFLLFNYVRGVEDRANEGTELVGVYVVRQDIPKGVFGEQADSAGWITQGQRPAQYRPAAAITDIDQIRGKVAVGDLTANQIVVQSMFIDPADAELTYAERIPEGMVTATVSVDSVRGVAGLLSPGDKVNILIADEGGSGDDPAAGAASAVTYTNRYLYQAVEILAVGRSFAASSSELSRSDDEPAQVVESGLVTFLVPPEAAQRIISAREQGLYLSLVPPDYEPRALPLLPAEPTLPGENASELTPYEPVADGEGNG